MATAVESNNATRKPKKGGKGPGQNSAVRLKTVVRKLPPNLPEDVFWQSVAPWVDDNTCTWKTFHAGKLKGVRFTPASVFSRAYISFKAPEQLATFSQAYDGHMFKDKQGNEYQAVVEFAPYQKVPSAPKSDNRHGTIDDDEDFKSFVTSLSAPDAPVETVAEPMSPPKSTPLLEALIQSKEKTSGGSKRSGPGGVLAILSRTQQLKEDEQHFSRASPIVPTEERTTTGAGGSEKEGVNIKGRGKRSAPPIQPGTPSTVNPNTQKQRQVSGGKPNASTTKQGIPAAAPSGDQQRAATPTKNRAPLPATSPDEARKKKRAKERAKKEKEKGKDKDKDEDEDEPTTPGPSGHQQAHAGGPREKPARKTASGQPIPAAASTSLQSQRGRTASVGAGSESGLAQVQEGESKGGPPVERGRGRGRGGGGGGGGGGGWGRGRGGRGGGAKEADKMDVQVKIIQRPTPIVAPPSAPAEPASVSTPVSASAPAPASTMATAPPQAESAGAEGGDGGPGGGGGGSGGGESRGGRGGQRGWRGRGRGGNYRGRGGRGRGE